MPDSPEPEGLSYFRFTPRHDKSSSSSPPVSPTATIDRPSIPVTPRSRRPAFKNRPHSDYDAIHSRVKVQTIEEDFTADKVPSTPELASKTRSQSTATSHRAATPVSVSSRHTTRSDGRRPSAARLGFEATVSPPTRPRPGHVWSRSKSGSIWYERLKQSPSQSQKSSQASDDSQSVPSRLLTPLRPPLAPVHGPVYHHQVKVETSFTESRPDNVSSDQEPSRAPTASVSKGASRRSSIDPRRLFSAPLRLLRMFSKQPENGTSKPKEMRPASTKADSKLQLPDHKSLLRRNRTGEALKQVTSILEQTTPATVINPLSTRTTSNRSATDSQDSRKHKHKHDRKMVKGLVLENPIAGHKSFQDLLQLELPTQTSSQMELKRGLQPHNTPDERATYTIKRSPSAETEDFLKIDISIRGGTSYLPSEARRIQTPPLPQDGLDGKKRGFFFDYNAPKGDESREPSIRAASPDPTGDPKVDLKLARRDTSKPPMIGRKVLTFKRRTTKTKTGDWYDAKLAELEIDDDESHLSVEELKPPGNRGRSTTTTSYSELVLARMRKEEEQMDYNIPEHLPSSPLCPRNKRYWRVVQGRGSQYRGCWMHGVGEYE